jgi:hypothetical protein
MHDRIDELAGLSAELRHCTQYATGRADQVRDQIDRVRTELSEHAEALEARAKELLTVGQDVPAAEATEAARGIRAVLDDAPTGHDASAKVQPAGTAGKQTAAAAKPPQKT